MRILVLGGTHYVGRSIVEAALERGDEVTTLNRGLSRTAAEGLVGVAVEGTKGVAVEVNCETDFVAKNDRFQDFVRSTTAVALVLGSNDVEALKAEARKGIKRMLRLWSPVHYRPGASRGSDGVESLSCLVLDYDDGTRVADASARWESFFHIVHTTWSHTDAHPKLRLTLPLVQPVRGADWGAVWAWAEQRTGQVIDPAMKGPGATYALPAVPSRSWPRHAFVHEGTLLDPVAFGIVDAEVGVPLEPHLERAPHFHACQV